MAWHNQYHSTNSARTNLIYMGKGGESGTFIYIGASKTGSSCRRWTGNSSDYFTTTNWNFSNSTFLTSKPSAVTAPSGTTGTVNYANISSSESSTWQGIWVWYKLSSDGSVNLDKWTNEYKLTISATTGGSAGIGNTTTTSGSYESGTSVTLKASVNSGYTFDGWYIGSTFKSSNLSYTYTTTSSAVTITAKFTSNTPTYYTVTINAGTGGSVRPSGTSSYQSGSTLTITATPNSGYKVSRWIRGGSVYAGSVNSITITVTGTTTIAVEFVSTTTYTLTISKQLNGSATSSTVMGTASGGGSYSSGSTASLTATTNTGYIFDGWYNSSGTLLNSSSSYNYTVTSSVTIIAKWLSYTDVTFKLNSGETYRETYESILLNNATLVGNLSSGSSYYNYPVGRSVNTTDTYSTNMYTSSGTAYIEYTFPLPLLTSGLSYAISVQCKGQAESDTIDDTHKARCSLYLGSSEIAYDNFTGQNTTSTITLTRPGLTATQLESVKLRFTVAHYGGKLFGVTVNIYASSSSDVTKRLTYNSTNYNKVGIVTTNNSSYQFTGWYTKPPSGEDGDKVYDNTGSYTTNSDYWSSGKWRYYDSSSSTLNLYTQEETYTLTVQYHLNGGKISDKVHQQSSGSTNYYTFKSDSLIYRCNSDGSNPFLFTHSFRCKPSESQNSQVKKCSSANTVWETGKPNLLNISSLYNSTNKVGLARSGYSTLPSGTSAWRSQPRGGYTISEDDTTVYAILGNQNLTQDTTITVYVNWGTSGTYALDVQYNLNGGTLQGSGTNNIYNNNGTYYKVINNLLYDCESDGTKAVPHRTHLEFSAVSNTINLLNVWTSSGTTPSGQNVGYVVTKSGYYLSNGAEYNRYSSGSSSGNISQDSDTVSNVLGSSTLSNNVVTIYINWKQTATYTIYLDHQGATSYSISTIYEKYGIGYYTSSSSEMQLIAITPPTKKGYKFQGYYTTSASSGGEQVIDSNGNLTTNYMVFSSTSYIYARWTTDTSKHKLTIQYNVNGGTIPGNTSVSGVHHHTNTQTGEDEYYRLYGSNGLVYSCNSSGNNRVIHTTVVQCTYANSASTPVDLTNVGTCGAKLSGYDIVGQSAYVTESGTPLHQGTTSDNYQSINNPATVYNILGENIYEDVTVTIFINWTTNTANIYVKTSSGWQKGVVYVKTSSGWIQGTPYVRTGSSTWSQGQ